MKFHNVLPELLGTKAKARVLQELLRFPTKQWTGRELARQARVSPPQALEALTVFQNYGIVRSMSVGRSVMWSVNPIHVLVKKLSPLVRLPEGLRVRVLDAIYRELGPQTVERIVKRIMIFGSVARGDEKPSSDIDVLLVVRNGAGTDRIQESLSHVALQFLEKYGNLLSTRVYTEQEASAKSKEILMQTIQSEGVLLYDKGEKT